MIANEITRAFPLPWSARQIATPKSATCHHESLTWAFFDATGKRVFMSEKICAALLKVVNGDRQDELDKADKQKNEKDNELLDFDWL